MPDRSSIRSLLNSLSAVASRARAPRSGSAMRASRVRRWTLACVAAVFVAGWASCAAAQLAERPPENRIWFDPSPQISVLTFGPGDAAFLKFGHNAIRVKYPQGGPDLVYNFGTFQFDNPLLIVDFLTGKFRYWLSVAAFPSVLAHYKRANRSVVEQQLALGKPAEWDVAEKLRINALPENRYYLYDYYRDNCSTRVRDVVDEALGGRFRERTQAPTQLTLRDHTLRLVADDFWLYVGLDIAMGPYIDQPETRWTEMFIPEKVEQGLDGLVFSGIHGTQQIVEERIEHYQARGRPQLRRRPPDRTLGFFQAGAAGGALLGFLGWEAHHRRKQTARTLLALLLGLLGLVAGVLGLLFSSLWAFTNHEVTYYNENILQCAPWAIVLVGCAWGIHRGRLGPIRLAYRVAMAALAASAAGLVAKFMPFMEQHNERIIALFVPLWMGAFTALHLMHIRAQRMLTVPIQEPQREAAEVGEEDDERHAKPSTRPPPAPEDEDDDEEEEEERTASVRPAPA